MNIMMCYDGSECARTALALARRFAEPAGATLHLVQVSPHNIAVDGVAWSGSNAVDIEKHRRAAAEDAALRTRLATLLEGCTCPVIVAVLDGERIGDDLVWYARQNHIDLIALGCREHGPMRGGVGGELTRFIVESRVAPVLLGPMAPAAHLDIRGIPRGCAVFSHDGVYLGDLERVEGERMLVGHAQSEAWFPVSDALELSMASGLRMSFDATDAPPSSMRRSVSEPDPAPRMRLVEPAGRRRERDSVWSE